MECRLREGNVREWNIVGKANQEQRKREECVRRFAESGWIEKSPSGIRFVGSPAFDRQGDQCTSEVYERDRPHSLPKGLSWVSIGEA